MIEKFRLHNKLHVMVKLVALLCLTIIVRKFDEIMLFFTFSLLAVALFLYHAPNAFATIKRLRWLICTMLLIYALNTPGEYISFGSDVPWFIAPTYEGIQAGVSQVLRLIVVVMALALTLARTNRDALIGSLYILLKPLSCFGLNPERFAVRLWLTLHYVEKDKALNGKRKLVKGSYFTQVVNNFNAIDLDEEMSGNIALQTDALKWLDVLILLIIIFMTVSYMEYF